MAYETKELEKQALEAIDEHNLVFISDVVQMLPCSKPTFYEHKLNELDTIKKALNVNKIKDKVKLRKKFKQSENPTLMLAYYKLIGTEDERQALGTKTDITSKGDRVNFVVPTGTATDKNDEIV